MSQKRLCRSFFSIVSQGCNLINKKTLSQGFPVKLQKLSGQFFVALTPATASTVVATEGVMLKNVFFEISQISHGNTCVGVSF